MKFVVEFYKKLDVFGSIIFWGIIVTFLLLIVVVIIFANRNKKLKQIIVSNGIDIDNDKNELAIKKVDSVSVKNDDSILNSDDKSDIFKQEKEQHFMPEEHVMEYDKDLFSLPNIKKATELPEENIEIVEEKKEIVMPTGPYQRNVLREMDLGQTSPIGIVKKDVSKVADVVKAEELHDSLKEDIKIDNILEPKAEQIETMNKANGEYLEEVSKKLSDANNNTDIIRTEYELKQEEDAIISYEELMRKKDSINIVSEEDAVISIEELMNRKKKEEQLYNITEKEGNDNFIDELKHFRSDL